MTTNILILSTGPYSGKSLLALGLGRHFQGLGKTVAYMKPIGTFPVFHKGVLTDQDAVFIASALDLSAPLDLICPLVLDRERRLALLEGESISARDKILKAHKTLTKGVDVCLLGGPAKPEDGFSLGVGGETLARLLKAKVILVDRGGDPEEIDTLFSLADRFKDRLAGVVINRIPPESRPIVERLVVPFLENNGIKVIGLIPQEDCLDFLTVEEIAEVLGGEIVAARDEAKKYVERFSVGAMQVESALRYFRRSRNKAVITGGDRSDIQLAALETSTRCLILTGGLYPNEVIIALASERKVPIMVVKEDTLTTVEQMDHYLGRLRIRGEDKVKKAQELVLSFCRTDFLDE